MTTTQGAWEKRYLDLPLESLLLVWLVSLLEDGIALLETLVDMLLLRVAHVLWRIRIRLLLLIVAHVLLLWIEVSLLN